VLRPRAAIATENKHEYLGLALLVISFGIIAFGFFYGKSNEIPEFFHYLDQAWIGFRETLKHWH
jgi:hypothetical protein